MKISVYNTVECKKISVRFKLSNVIELVPVVTRVYLDAPLGHTSNKPIFITPDLNMDGDIPLTPPFMHYKGLLFFETFLSYGSMSGSDEDETLALARRLLFDYSIFDCQNNHQAFTVPDTIDLVPSKKLIYVTKKIDLV